MILNTSILNQQNSSDLLWVKDNLQYEVITGSHAYGINVKESDYDIVGITIPPKEYLFPILYGKIPGFSKVPRFDQLHIKRFNYSKTTAEGVIYNIVKYFKLTADNNPNMIDTLFVRDNFITHSTKIGKMIRDNRKLFVSKRCWHTFKGYAYAQLHKLRVKNPEGKRKDLVEKFGYDVKFAAHVVRLLTEVEQLLEHGEMDLMKNKELLKTIRRGEWTLEQIEDYFNSNVKRLEDLYDKSKLPYSVDQDKLDVLLMNCLEEFYGDISFQKNISRKKLLDAFQKVANDLQTLIDTYR